MQLITRKIERAPLNELFPSVVDFWGRGPTVGGVLVESALEGGGVVCYCFEGRRWDELAQERVFVKRVLSLGLIEDLTNSRWRVSVYKHLLRARCIGRG